MDFIVRSNFKVFSDDYCKKNRIVECFIVDGTPLLMQHYKDAQKKIFLLVSSLHDTSGIEKDVIL